MNRQNGNGFNRTLDTGDIEGAQPKRLFSSGSGLGDAGRNIMSQYPAGFNMKQ
jgi:hypothetical protein